MKELEDAVELYCLMLLYPNTSANPNDDRRLYSISYWQVKLNVSFDDIERYLFKYLALNDQINLNENDMKNFIKNRIGEIKNGSYIISRIQHFF